ncbi:uncharacterized protein LOC123899610 [Trifolium pratense]|uniref:uncharacterized protein LOC123899610 n=1 Tax=Trifolium pratense TaxID=57577 RepID=UPI001E6918DA|nr:uncharacterized protein LOC123899610 [Trifolium pratense]
MSETIPTPNRTIRRRSILLRCSISSATVYSPPPLFNLEAQSVNLSDVLLQTLLRRRTTTPPPDVSVVLCISKRMRRGTNKKMRRGTTMIKMLVGSSLYVVFILGHSYKLRMLCFFYSFTMLKYGTMSLVKQKRHYSFEKQSSAEYHENLAKVTQTDGGATRDIQEVDGSQRIQIWKDVSKGKSRGKMLWY